MEISTLEKTKLKPKIVVFASEKLKLNLSNAAATNNVVKYDESGGQC